MNMVMLTISKFQSSFHLPTATAVVPWSLDVRRRLAGMTTGKFQSSLHFPTAIAVVPLRVGVRRAEGDVSEGRLN